jgi:hypothetical protein
MLRRRPALLEETSEAAISARATEIANKLKLELLPAD